jgi:hypothetical protein
MYEGENYLFRANISRRGPVTIFEMNFDVAVIGLARKNVLRILGSILSNFTSMVTDKSRISDLPLSLDILLSPSNCAALWT